MAHTKQPSSTLRPKKFKGFTLIELIVVITILAILGTIGFLSIGGYSSKARDSARVGDAAQISKSLDLSIVTAGDYPVPDNAFSVTYSGGVVWNQGTIGSRVLQAFRSSIAGGGLNDKPTDPLTNKEYTYSELAEGKAYQIKVDYEGDLAQTALDTSLVIPAYAAPGNPTIAYIRGNYGGLTAKTTTGSIVYVLAIPSIITNSGTTVNGYMQIENNALSGTLLFNGRSLVNATTYNPNTRPGGGVVYSGTTLPANDTTGQITSMVTALKVAYTGADIVSNSNITSLMVATGSTAIQSLGSMIVKDQLGGSAVSGGGGGSTVTNNRGEQLYATPGSYTWVVPAEVTSISVVCVGGGGGGYDAATLGSISHGGGGGAGLGYKNNITVTPGASHVVNIGAGGTQISRTGQAGWDSYFSNTSLIRGIGGKWGTTTVAGAWGSFVGDGGGNGGNGYFATNSSSWHGGGGAGGYSGNGGNGGISASLPTGGLGGAGGGGNHLQGGGVWIYGIGANGAAGDTTTYVGNGGSWGAQGSNDAGGGKYWAGGAGNSGIWGSGACRIIWPGNTRLFPSTNVGA